MPTSSPLMRKIVVRFAAAATALMCVGAKAEPSFLSTWRHAKSQYQRSRSMLTLPSSPPHSSEDAPPVNIVSLEAFVEAIDILKTDMGIEIIPQEKRPVYAIGKLVAPLPLHLVSGIRFADCGRLTLISQMKESVVDATGLQSLDTIVAVRVGSGSSDGSFGFERSTNGETISDTAQAYTSAINYATQNDINVIELEVNRLVPLMPSIE